MNAIVDVLKSWQLHPVVDHFTVALVIIAVLVDLAASIFSTRVWLRYMALTLLILGAIAAFGSNLTGGWEADRVWDSVAGPAKEVLRRHAELGDYLPWIVGVLALWRLAVQFLGFLAGSRPLYLIVAVIVALAVIYQGREGGLLVYDYGVGTALMNKPQAEATPMPAPTVATPVPTVFVPTATPTAASTPVPPAPATSAGATPAPTPTATASGASANTPVYPPGGAAPSAVASPAATGSVHNL